MKEINGGCPVATTSYLHNTVASRWRRGRMQNGWNRKMISLGGGEGTKQLRFILMSSDATRDLFHCLVISIDCAGRLKQCQRVTTALVKTTPDTIRLRKNLHKNLFQWHFTCRHHGQHCKINLKITFSYAQRVTRSTKNVAMQIDATNAKRCNAKCDWIIMIRHETVGVNLLESIE